MFADHLREEKTNDTQERGDDRGDNDWRANDERPRIVFVQRLELWQERWSMPKLSRGVHGRKEERTDAREDRDHDEYLGN